MYNTLNKLEHYNGKRLLIFIPRNFYHMGKVYGSVNKSQIRVNSHNNYHVYKKKTNIVIIIARQHRLCTFVCVSYCKVKLMERRLEFSVRSWTKFMTVI